MYILITEPSLQTCISLTDGEANFKGIRIYKRENYFITLSKGYSFKDGTKTKVLEIRKYTVFSEEGFYPIEIFVYEGERKRNFCFFANENFLLSAQDSTHVKTLDPYLKNSYLLIKDGILEARSKYLTVNGRRYSGEKLKDGDRVEMLSFFMIYFSSFLYIDTSFLEVRLKPYPVNRHIIVYQEEEPPVAAVYPREETAAPSLPEIRPYEQPVRQREQLFRQIVPAFFMSLAMCFLAYYNSSSPVFLVMPATMMFSGVAVPVIFSLWERRKERKKEMKDREDYRRYLEKLKNRIHQNVENFLVKEEQEEIRRDRFPEGLFQGDTDRLLIQLGYRRKEFPLTVPETEDPLILEEYEQIKEETVLPSCPFFLELKGRRKISFLLKNSEKAGVFRRILCECAFRFPFSKVKIAIALHDPDEIRDLYRLPHLYMGERRLILTSLRDLEEADQKMKKEKLIVFLLDPFDYSFTDPDILTLSFSSRETFPESDTVIEYRHQDAVLYEGKTVTFQPFPEEDLSLFFSYLQRFSLFSKNRTSSFRDLFTKLDIRGNYEGRLEGLTARFAVVNGEMFSLDIHEKSSGPHGLIGGATGSGKSELIISFLLSLCLFYPPSYFQIILIDFKGSGIRDSLTYEGRMIPHLAACTDDLDDVGVERLLYSLKKECRRREALFQKAGETLHSPIADLDAYLEEKTEEMEDLPHLLIIVDEFAQLKKEHPEMIRELIAISRIGRSLGMHLILSTQRPSSAVDEEIYANSRFKIALRVFEEKESADLLHRKDAAYLKEPGEFILSVDNALYKGRSLYSKSDPEHDPCRIALLDAGLRVRKEKRILFPGRKAEIKGFLKEILEVTDFLQIPSHELVFRAPLMEKRKSIKGCYHLGRKDDYIRAERDLLCYPLTESLLIVSTRKNEADIFLNAAEEEEIPIILFSDRRREGKYISDCLLYEEKEDIFFLVKTLEQPHEPSVLFIENVSLFLSYDETYVLLLEKILKNPGKYSLYPFLVSPVSFLPHRILSSAKTRVLIGSSSREDQMNLFCRVSDRKGGSFFEDGEILPFVPVLTEQRESSPSVYPPFLKKIPESRKRERKDGACLLGYEIKSREKIFYPADEKLLVISLHEELLRPYRSYGYDCQLYEGKGKTEEDVLWLGDGIDRQRLFFPPFSGDIKKEDAYLYSHMKKALLKGVNHE